MNFKSLLLVLGLGMFSACGISAGKLYTPTEANAKKANMTVDNLLEGKVLYINKCNECHKLNKPEKHTSELWTAWLNDMQERAKISDAEKKKIHAYLTSKIEM